MNEEDILFFSEDIEKPAIIIDEEFYKNLPDDYLFRVNTFEKFSVEFWTIAAEMAQLNDYCVLLLQETYEKLKTLKSELGDLQSGKKRIITEDELWGGDYTGEVMMMLEEKVQIWEDTYGFITRATCFLLLSSFLEKSLKSLCDTLCLSNKKPSTRGGSKIDLYLKFLQDECQIRIKETNENKLLRNKFRMIRNAFAHGDWDQVRTKIGDINLRGSFASATNLLNEIEVNAWLSPWGKIQEQGDN